MQASQAQTSQMAEVFVPRPVYFFAMFMESIVISG